MWGGDDPDDRMPMVWEDLKYDTQTSDPLERPRRSDAVGFDQQLHDYYRDAITLRHRIPALRRGTWKTVVTDDAAKGLGFVRQDGDSWALVMINRGDDVWGVDLPADQLPLTDGDKLRVELISAGPAESVRVKGPERGKLRVELPGLTGVVLVPDHGASR